MKTDCAFKTVHMLMFVLLVGLSDLVVVVLQQITSSVCEAMGCPVQDGNVQYCDVEIPWW